MQKILIAPDSFKDSLTAFEACQAIEAGIRLADPNAECLLMPLADGGEGTAKILTHHAGGSMLETASVDPLFRPIKAGYGLSKNGETAFIDMAECSGLQLLKKEERNPSLTSTYGTGLLIKNAIERGAKKIVLGIGGSATNDSGIGMARALGFEFYDKNGKTLGGRGRDLEKVVRFSESPFLSENNIEVEVLCDVNNPLFGSEGAAHVYAPQKGADEEMVDQLDQGLRHIARVVAEQTQTKFENLPGAGAAGGMGYAGKVFLNTDLISGIDKIMEMAAFEKHLETADLVITGEGKIDRQTAHGKLIAGICRKAKKYGVPVVALCGSLTASPEEIKKIGLQAAFSILNRPMDLEEALRQAPGLLRDAAFSLMKLIHLDF